MLGNSLAGAAGAQAGGRAGKAVGAHIAKLFGSGDYTMNTPKTNSLFPGASVGYGAHPTFDDGRGVRVMHREFVQDLIAPASPGQFGQTSFNINPGDFANFPWLASIAANYEQYRFHALVFEFVSSVAPFGATSLGTNVMAMQYNASANDFVDKRQMENSDYAISDRLDRSMLYGVECAPDAQAMNYLYVRAGSSTGMTTASQDLGRFSFATVAGDSAPLGTTLGELWVSYEIELIRPRATINRPGWFCTARGGFSGTTPLGTAALGGLAPIATGRCRDFAIDSSSLVLNGAVKGDVFKIECSANGPTGTRFGGGTTLVGCEPLAIYSNPDGNLMSANNGALLGATTTNQYESDMLSIIVRVTSPRPAVPGVVFSGPFNSPGLSVVNITVTCLGNGLLGDMLSPNPAATGALFPGSVYGTAKNVALLEATQPPAFSPAAETPAAKPEPDSAGADDALPALPQMKLTASRSAWELA